MIDASRDVRGRGDGGAALVEFAIIVPVLFLVIFAIIEFGWAWNQMLDVRHGARESARLVAVNYQAAAEVGDAQRAAIIAESCERMKEGAGVITSIEITRTGAEAGDKATVRVSRPLDTLTGFLDFALGGIELESDADTRLEQDASWSLSTTGAESCPP